MNSTLTVRTARIADLDDLMAIEAASFPGDRLSRRQMRRHISSPAARIWVCDGADGKPAAYLLAFFASGRAPRIYSLATAAVARGKGMAAALLAQMIDAALRAGAAKILLEVRTDSAAAIALYMRTGFVTTRRLPNYYEDGCDGMKMMMTLAAGGGRSSK